MTLQTSVTSANLASIRAAAMLVPVPATVAGVRPDLLGPATMRALMCAAGL